MEQKKEPVSVHFEQNFQGKHVKKWHRFLKIVFAIFAYFLVDKSFQVLLLFCQV